MNTKLLYLVLFAAAGVAITGATLTSVYGTGALTKTLVEPTNNIANYASPMVFNFTGSSSTTAVKTIVIAMPAYTSVWAATTLITSQGIPTGAGTISVTNAGSGSLTPTITLTLSSAQALTNKNISLFIGKINNPTTSGMQTVTFTTKDGSGNPIDTGSGTYYTWYYSSPSVKDNGTLNNGALGLAGNVGIGTTGNATQRLEVNGTTQFDGNVTALHTHEFKITAPVGVPICIGKCQ